MIAGFLNFSITSLLDLIKAETYAAFEAKVIALSMWNYSEKINLDTRWMPVCKLLKSSFPSVPLLTKQS
jgi:hypothetical protein